MLFIFRIVAVVLLKTHALMHNIKQIFSRENNNNNEITFNSLKNFINKQIFKQEFETEIEFVNKDRIEDNVKL